MQFKKLFLFIAVIATLCFSEDNDNDRFKFNGWGFFTFGRVESSVTSGSNFDFNFNKEILSDFDAGLKCSAKFGENGKARLHFALTTAYQVLNDEIISAEFARRKWVVYLIDAAIEDSKKSDDYSLFGEFGYFPVKYNPEARNLGEYLFRSGTYPGYLNSGFELADKEKLLGLHGSFKYNFGVNNDVKADLWFTNDIRDFPIRDFSLSYIFSANLGRFADIGIGLSHAHMISFDKRNREPATDTMRLGSSSTKQWAVIVDTANNDTINATFKGTKAMGRATLDPKAFFGETIFGKEDLKVYAELGFLGVKNYPVWYEKPSERMPFMFGFNFPTFKILDVLSFEFEHYSSPYLNTSENVWIKRSPLPYTSLPYPDKSQMEPITNDDWKWSVYASKQFKRIKLSGQIASDHILKTPYVPGPPAAGCYKEICPRTKDWYWMLRVMYFF